MLLSFDSFVAFKKIISVSSPLVERELSSFPVSLAVSCSLLNAGGDSSSNNYTVVTTI